MWDIPILNLNVGILCEILSVPHNTIKNMNNVMNAISELLLLLKSSQEGFFGFLWTH
jgi:hypothetical protein